ncbi:hypothetical protein JST97_06035 [bacterium]|nr:hypothetical protein [bacterium]
MHPRGSTLAETLVAASLGLVILAVLSFCMVLSGRFWIRADETQTAQQEALAVQVRLEHDYRASRFGSLQVQETVEQTELAFLSYESSGSGDTLWTPQGEIVWRKWVRYRYQKSTGRLERREFPLPEPSNKPDLTAPGWPRGTSGTLLASHLSQFELVQARPDLPLLHVRYTARVGQAGNQAQTLVLPRLYGPDMQ